MTRLILTFETLHKLLSAEKALQAGDKKAFRLRPTPTPPGISDAICGMSLELLEKDRADEVLDLLKTLNMAPAGIHEVD